MRRHLHAKILFRGRFGRTVAVVGVAILLGAGLTASVPSLSTSEATGPVTAGTSCATPTATLVDQAEPASAKAPAFQALVSPRAAKPTTVSYDGAELVVGPDAVSDQITVGVTPLSTSDLPTLDAGMTDVTQGPRAGYRFTPHPYSFAKPIQITLPYDLELVGPDASAQDIKTYFYDEQSTCWRPLQRVSVDEQRHVVVSVTDHFTDMINATVTAPDHPEGASFNPTQIKDIQNADPGSQVNLVDPPKPDNTGDAKLSYPLDLPAGRQGMQPQLSVQYDSSGGDGWVGLGWNVAVPMISVDTTQGVPRYDAASETETYLLGGSQLTPTVDRNQAQPRTTDKVFHTRVETDFAKIIRHGDGPRNYTWEVVDRGGSHSFYGGSTDSTLTDDSGDVFAWALQQVRDTKGNLVRYHTVRQQDFGVPDGGTVAGSQLYLQKITYTGHGDTEGPYAVTFVRDRDLGEPRRPDVTIDARGGFKRVTADLLRKVEVTFNGQPIRRYELDYQTGAFMKTLLKSVSQFGEDGKLFTSHEFTYYDDIRDAAGQYQAFTQSDWNSPADNLGNGAVNSVSGGAGDASGLGANTSHGVDGHLYVGYGPTLSKRNSIGVKAGYGSSTEDGLLALVDVDGDGLPDKVFKSGDGVVYRKNLARPGGEATFSDQAQPVQNLPALLTEDTSSLTLGVEAYPGAVAAQLDHVDTFTTTSRYFLDVNGDGLIDFVDNGSVLFGRIGSDGLPTFGNSSQTPVPIGSGKVSTDGLINDFTADRSRRDDTYPLIDTVRRWVAPFDGTVAISGAVKLASPSTTPGADGVRVAIQQEDNELWSTVIGAPDGSEHAPSGVDSVPVHRGDRLYFRVGSRDDGSNDQVSWDPVIAYQNVPDGTDVNGLNPYKYQASKDFTLGGRTATLTAPTDGTLHLGGALTKKAATTDDVGVVITRDGEIVLQKSLPASAVDQIPVDLDIPVKQGQQLTWRVQVDSPIDLSTIAWTPSATYTAAAGVARLTDNAGDPVLTTNPPYAVDMYPVDLLTSPQGNYTAPQTGTLTVQPTLDFGTAQPDAKVVFTVKRKDALLGKKVIDVSKGQLPPADSLSLNVPVNQGDQLFFDFSTTDPNLAAALVSQSATVGADTVPTGFHSAATEGAFAQPYRGWGVIGYNGNKDRAGQPIVQGDLVLDNNYRDQLPTSVDPQKDAPAFEADPRLTPPKVFEFTPEPQTGRWSAGDFSWAGPDTASSSRLGGPSVALPESSDFQNVTAVPRISRSQQTSLTGSVGGDIGSVGGSVATGDSASELDYLDMNGDHFPDVVGNGRIQYTDPSGALGGQTGSLPDGSVRESHNEAGNASAGSAARTISTGRGLAAPTGDMSSNTAQSGNDMPPLGIGGDLGAGKSDERFDLVDVNGDGLPDRAYDNGKVALNLGYKFAAAEQWPGSALTAGATANTGVNIGFNTDFYAFAGGVALNQGHSTSKSTLADVNGDGLPDRVFDGTPLQVSMNTGSGFAPAVPFYGSLSGVTRDGNATLGGGVYFTFGICFGPFGCIVVNPGAGASTGANRTEQTLRDINGDGFADQVESTKDNKITVAQNNTGRTNLLKSVSRPLGSRIDLDYSRDGNTYDLPQSHWVLSRVAVNDGQSGDGQDTQLTTFRYDGGRYDRLEHEFLGFGTVVTETRDPGNHDALYRSSTQEYRTDGYYTRGLVSRELTTDAAGKPFLETLNTFQLVDVATGQPADPSSANATIFPQLVRVDRRFYEGQPTPGKSTYTETTYDDVGNVVRSVDGGDTGTADDVVTTTGYSASVQACRDNNILNVANAVETRGGGTVMRHRESDVDCSTGNVTQVRAFLANGDRAVTDMTYDDIGNLTSVTGPPNSSGQRYKLAYTYDPDTSQYVASITDSFGYRSTTTYNPKYGKQETTTDFNNQVMRYAYDSVGRIASVTGPYEAAQNLVSVSFEYHPEAATPYAVSRHLDRDANGAVRPDTIDTVTLVDGFKRIVQTKQDATVGDGKSDPQNVMTVSGRQVFDFLGRAVEMYYPTTEAKGPDNTKLNTAFDSVQPSRTTYDILDRATKTVLPDDTVDTTSYGFGPDRDGVTQFETVDTDANGVQKRTYQDVRDQTTAVKEFNTNAVVWTSYAYDPLGQLVKVIDDHGNTTSTAYDNFGRRTVIDSPDAGRTETAYDLADNQIHVSTANLAAIGKSVDYVYDFNRLTQIKYPTFPQNNVTYTYGAPGAADNGASRIVKVVDGSGVVRRGYGPLGEVTKETRTVLGHSYTTQYKFDTWNRVLQMTYPDGEVLSYHYDSGGQVDGATGVKGKFSYPYLKRLDYDKFGQRVLMVDGNGVSTNYTYNTEDRRLENQQSLTAKGYAFQNLDYGYDSNGNVTSLANDVKRPPLFGLGGPTTQKFSYDNLNQLTSASGEFRNSVTDVVNTYHVDMSYDSLHNITNKDQSNVLVGLFPVVQHDKTYDNDYAYNSGKPHAPSVVGDLRMTYDNNGNETGEFSRGIGPGQEFVWDEANRLACANTDFLGRPLPQKPSSCDFAQVRFSYDDQGDRVVKDAGLLGISIYPNQGYTQRGLTAFKHVFIGDTRLVTKAVEDPHFYEGEQFYYQPDQIGSDGYITDARGEVTGHEEYFPSGETWVDQQSYGETPYKFTGKEYDSETGLYYYGDRYYDPRTSRWQSTDPQLASYLGGKPNGGVQNSNNLNLYGYAAQNPERYTDPTGGYLVDPKYVAAAGAAIEAAPAAAALAEGCAAICWTGIGLVAVAVAGAGVAAYYYYNRPTLKAPSPKTDLAEEPDEQPSPLAAPVAAPQTQTAQREDDSQRLVYVTYTKTNPTTGEVYAGRTSGYGDPLAAVAARDIGHHKTAQGFGPAVIDQFAYATRDWSQRWSDPAYQAIRGREQQVIDVFGGAKSDRPLPGSSSVPGFTSGNDIRGVAKANPLGRIYHDQSSRQFPPELAPYTGY